MDSAFDNVGVLVAQQGIRLNDSLQQGVHVAATSVLTEPVRAHRTKGCVRRPVQVLGLRREPTCVRAATVVVYLRFCACWGAIRRALCCTNNTFRGTCIRYAKRWREARVQGDRAEKDRVNIPKPRWQEGGRWFTLFNMVIYNVA